MKKMITKVMAIGLIALTTMTLTSSCENGMSGPTEDLYTNLLEVSSDGTSTMILKNLDLAFVPSASLTDQEKSWLVQMEEEEKLARDVYTFLYQKWGSEVFSRIAEAESNHLNAVLRLETYYGEKASAPAEAGKFNDPETQSLYDRLTEKGTESIAEAYKAGALIEERDIKDLRQILAVAENENIRIVFENLERGSRNHSRAFNRQLTALGITYLPGYISSSDYDLIVASPVEKGNQYRVGAKGHKGKGKGNGTGNGNGNGRFRKGNS